MLAAWFEKFGAARDVLAVAGYSWDSDGKLLYPA